VRKLAALGLALVVAFVVAPGPLAGIGSGGGLGSQRQLRAAFRGAFVGYWGSGAGERTADMDRIVDYWFRYHLVKGVTAALLLAVLVAIGVRLFHGAQYKVVAVSALGVLALGTVMANVQGAVAPFASLMPLLVDTAPDPALAGTLVQVRERLAAGGGVPPAAHAMVADFALYHEIMVVVAALVAIGLAVAGVLLWRGRARWTLGVGAGLACVAALVVAMANAGTAADPAPALLGLFNGSW
jgi:hypothetical protein